MRCLSFLYILFTFTALRVLAQKFDKNPGVLLSQMTEAINTNKFPGIHSVLIFHNDSLAYEHYFNGYSMDSLHDSRSSFKSVIALLVGIATDRGLIKNTSQKVLDFFPEYASLKIDKRKRAITIQNLLDMESGLDCEEFNGTKDCEDEMVTTKDWVKFALNLPMKNSPGKVWAYTSCNPMIISGVISRAAHMPVMDFAKKYLFTPLGIVHYKWTKDPAGNGMTAGSFYILPSDMLKLGRLVNDGGEWNGEQLITKKWIKLMTKCSIAIPGFSFVRSGRSKIARPQQTTYGNYWYRELLVTAGFKENMLFASGNGGQYIIIIKKLNLVVVFTQGNYGTWKAKQAFDILAHYILPGYE